jgi:alpha-galactosidase
MVKKLLIAVAISAAFAGAQTRIDGKNVSVEFDASMHSRILAFQNTPIGPMSASETIVADGKTLSEFALTSQHTEPVHDKIGEGKRLIVEGKSGDLIKIVSVSVYDDFPAVAVFEVSYKSSASAPLEITQWTNNHYDVEGSSLWAFQPGTYERRPAWVSPLHPGAHQKNFLGMNGSDYGGGTPFADIWSRNVGIAVGDLELVGKEVSLPVTMTDAKRATLALEYAKTQKLEPGGSFATFRTFAIVHHGDFLRCPRHLQKDNATTGAASLGKSSRCWLPSDVVCLGLWATLQG